MSDTTDKHCRQLVRPEIDPGNAYRRLLPCETLLTGDEYWCNGEWLVTGDVGYFAEELPYRRLRGKEAR